MAKYTKAILKEKLTIKLTDGYKISKTISEWLKNINKKQSVIKSKNGLILDSHKLYLDLVEKQIPVCNLVEEKYAKNAISNAIMFHLNEVTGSKIENIVMIYPGRFQPMGKHHAEVYKILADIFGEENAFIATTNKVQLPKSPLNFEEKLKVINKHGITNVINVKNPYKADEITSRFDPETTAVLFVVGDKDMRENPRFRIGFKRNGEPTYFQKYDENKDNLQSYVKHGYLYVAPHVSLDVPGYGEMSGTTLRQALATANEEDFENIMGFFDPEIYEMLKAKFSNLQETSFISGSNVVGYTGKKEEEEEKLVNEVYDYLLKQGFIK